jgi:membrane protein
MLLPVPCARLAADLRREIREDHLATGAAALAFYWMLSLFPAAIFLLTLLAFLPIPHLERSLMHAVRDALPGDAAELFRGVVEGVAFHRRGGVLSLGVLLTAWSTSRGIPARMQELNAAYDVEERRPFWKRRAVALVVALSFVVLIIGAFLLMVFGRALQQRLGHAAGWSGVVVVAVTLLRWSVVCVALLLGLAVVYRFGPDVEQRFRFVSPGTVVGVVMLIGVSLGFQILVRYVVHLDVTYGSLAAAITLMLWLYLAGWAILLGAELDATLRSYGSAPAAAVTPRRGSAGRTA